jgi:hypothetical protein
VLWVDSKKKGPRTPALKASAALSASSKRVWGSSKLRVANNDPTRRVYKIRDHIGHEIYALARGRRMHVKCKQLPHAKGGGESHNEVLIFKDFSI